MEKYVEIGHLAGYHLYTDPQTLSIMQVFEDGSSTQKYKLQAEQFIEVLDKVEEYMRQQRNVKTKEDNYRLLAKQRGFEHDLAEWTNNRPRSLVMDIICCLLRYKML